MMHQIYTLTKRTTNTAFIVLPLALYEGATEIGLLFLTILNLLFSSFSSFSLSLPIFRSLFFILELIMLRNTKRTRYLLKGLFDKYFPGSLKMNGEYPCGIFTKTVANLTMLSVATSALYRST